jgi:hypothetical protein
MMDGEVAIKVEATIGKGVGSDVEDPHQDGASAQAYLTTTEVDLILGAGFHGFTENYGIELDSRL